jgi:hypothetical protein
MKRSTEQLHTVDNDDDDNNNDNDNDSISGST